MFKAIVIIRKSLSSVVRRIDVDAFHLSGELLFQCLKGEEVVAVDEHVVEDVLAVPAAYGGVMGFSWVLDEDAWLKARTLVLADPGEFEFLKSLLAHGCLLQLP
jgi:hypothetical protein